MLFVLQDVTGVDEVANIPGFQDSGYDTAAAVLEESAKFFNEVVAPLNWDRDQNPSSLKPGVVTTTTGFKEAFKQFGEAGWQGIIHPTEFGNQSFPKLTAAACSELMHAANTSFALCQMLIDRAIEAMLTAASDELK